jgi:hypothetical protein
MARKKSEVFECDGCEEHVVDPSRTEKGGWLSLDAANATYAREAAALACPRCRSELLSWLADRKRRAQDKAFMERVQKEQTHGAPYR